MAAGGRAVTRLSAPRWRASRRRASACPSAARTAEDVGILHLGIGAFHRAHQAVFTEDAAVAAGEPGWGICGVTQRSAAVVDQLSTAGLPVRRAGARDAVSPPCAWCSQVSRRARSRPHEDDRLRAVRRPGRARRHADRHARRATGARPRRAAWTSPTRSSGPTWRADRAARSAGWSGACSAAPPREPGGLSVLSLRQPHRQRLRPPRPGAATSARRLPAAEGEAQTAAWIERHVAFPSSMVDRIVPATTDADRPTRPPCSESTTRRWSWPNRSASG